MENHEDIIELFLDRYENKVVLLLSEYISNNKRELDYMAYTYYLWEPYDVGLCSYILKDTETIFDGGNYLIRLHMELLVDIFTQVTDLKTSINYVIEARVDENLDYFQMKYIGLDVLQI